MIAALDPVASVIAGAEPWVQATITAGAVGGAHWIGHLTFGDSVYFSKAAVQQAGLTVLAATWLVVWVAVGGLAGVMG